MQAADESIDDKSEREEDEDCEIVEMCDGDAYDRMVNSKNRGSQPMVAQFLNAARKFTEKLEDLRKQELMGGRGKTACKSLDYDEMQPPSRGRPQKFTPPRRATQLISASPDDCEFEADSMTSQSSRTARTRLTEKFEVVRIFSRRNLRRSKSTNLLRTMQKRKWRKLGNSRTCGEEQPTSAASNK